MDHSRLIANLSPRMIEALREAMEDGTIQGARRDTELALVARGLAEAVWGDAERKNRYSRLAQTVYDAYQGARLTDLGREMAATLKNQEA